MYKIYINSTPIFLLNTAAAQNKQRDDKNLVARYLNIKRTLFHYIDMLEKNDAFDSITLHSNNLEQLKNDFFGIFKIVEAAGGVVKNADNEILMIYRRGFWDLPKGKIDKGEGIQEAAIREVQEETGIQQLELLSPITTTYHTYRNRKNVRCLKPTYWFLMKTPETAITVQTEEDIEEGVWIKKEDFLNSNRPVYGSIVDVLNGVH